MKDLDELNRMLTSSTEEERRLAVVELARHPFSQVRRYLFQALGDSSWRVRKEAVDAVLAASPGPEEIEEFIELLSVPENAGLRNSSVVILQSLGDQALPHLCRRLEHEDAGVRKFVVDILGTIGSESAAQKLIPVLVDPDPNVAAAAAESLGAIGAGDAVPVLIDSLTKDDLLFRYSVLEALTKIGRPVPLPVLTSLAGQQLLKKAVIDCLRAVGTVEAIPLLLDALTERARTVREAAVLALATIYQRTVGTEAEQACRQKLALLAGSPATAALLTTLAGNDAVLKRAAIILLGLAGDVQAMPSLLLECRSEPFYDACLQAFRDFGEPGARALFDRFPVADDEERCIIVHLFGEIGASGMESVLAAALRDRFPLVRKFAAESVGKAGVAELAGATAQLLDDPSPEVRRSAVNALARLAPVAGETVAGIAASLAEADRPEKRLDGTKLLAALGDHDRLSLMAKDPDPAVRRTAVACLGNLRNQASITHLSLALTDEEPDVRVAAATALGQIGGRSALNTLVMVLGDQHAWVQVAALKSIGRLADTAAIPAIANLVAGSEGVVLITALETLTDIAGAQAIPSLVKATGSSDDEVANAALDLLQRFPDGWIREVGEHLLTHENRSIRRKVARLLMEHGREGAVPLLERAAVNETDEMTRRYLLDLVDKVR